MSVLLLHRLVSCPCSSLISNLGHTCGRVVFLHSRISGALNSMSVNLSAARSVVRQMYHYIKSALDDGERGRTSRHTGESEEGESISSISSSRHRAREYKRNAAAAEAAFVSCEISQARTAAVQMSCCLCSIEIERQMQHCSVCLLFLSLSCAVCMS